MDARKLQHGDGTTLWGYTENIQYTGRLH